MPSSTHFRLKIICEDKEKIELSAIHLYNDNVRVDEAATITTGFTSNTVDIDILKNASPLENVALTVNPTSSVRKSTLYVIWTFSSAVNVNAFRIGTGESELTMVNKFILSYSANSGLTYSNFINIGVDKKLSYPGPWQLTQLKPVGECFPLVLKREKDFNPNINNTLTVDEDGRSFHGVKKEVYPYSHLTPLNFVTAGYTSNNYFQEIPGYFKSGKFYFEVSVENLNIQDTANNYSYIALGLLPDNTETITRAISPTVTSPAFTINTFFGSTIAANGSFTTGATMGTKVQLVSGYQMGFSIDFDNRELKYYNPSYNTTGYGPFAIPNSETTFKTIAVGTAYKLFFFYSANNYSMAGNIKLNVGQSSFINALPAGSQNGFGPRWKEEVDSTATYIPYTFETYNQDYDPLEQIIVQRAIEIYSEKPIIVAGCGTYYIKGYITRTPDIQNKRFLATLFSSNNKRVIAQCLVSSSGLYEFFGIEYGSYTILSVDLKDNTVSEAIGPVYPLPIV